MSCLVGAVGANCLAIDHIYTVQIYLFLFGIVICLLECNNFFCTGACRRSIELQARFLARYNSNVVLC